MKTLNSFCRTAETEYALSTKSVNLLYYDLPKHFHDEYRSYDAPRFCTILEGTKEVSINSSERFKYQKDQFVLLPPHSNVYMSMSEYTKALVYEFNDAMVERVKNQVTDQLEVNISPSFSHNNFQLEQVQTQISAIQQRVQTILHRNDPNTDFLLDLTCQELVYELLKRQGCFDILHHYKDHPINKALRLIHATPNTISVSHLAEELGMSLASFSQKFKLVTQISPKDYVTQARMNQAKLHLKTMTVTDTAYEVGYENISHFIRVFKQQFGVTPKQYKMGKTSAA